MHLKQIQNVGVELVITVGHFTLPCIQHLKTRFRNTSQKIASFLLPNTLDTHGFGCYKGSCKQHSGIFPFPLTTLCHVPIIGDLGVWFLFWSLAGSLLKKQNSAFHHPSRNPKHSYHFNHSRMHAPSSGTVAAVTFHLLIFVRRFSVCFGHFCWQMPVLGVLVLTKLPAFFQSCALGVHNFSLQHRAWY